MRTPPRDSTMISTSVESRTDLYNHCFSVSDGGEIYQRERIHRAKQAVPVEEDVEIFRATLAPPQHYRRAPADDVRHTGVIERRTGFM